MTAEGWYRDPFDLHQLRWFSAGTPSRLVRDADVEAYDDPPTGGWDGPLVPYLPEPTAGDEGADELLRADQEAAKGADYEPGAVADAALDRGAASGLGFS